MKTKDFQVRIKAVGPDDGLSDGEFEAIVSAFGNVDSVGDVVQPGAFADDLKAWADSGDSIPVVWSHRWEDPFAHIGHVVKAEEVAEGLRVVGQIDDLDTNPTAQQVHRLLKGRRVTQFSFAYDVLDGAFIESEEDGQYYELRKLKVYEVGPCLVGANQETQLLAAKAQSMLVEAKAGRVLSGKNLGDLRSARDLLAAVIASQEGDDEKAATPQTSEAPASDETDEPSQAADETEKDEEPKPAKSQTDSTAAPRRALAVATITNLP